jgi:hypothetical protein
MTETSDRVKELLKLVEKHSARALASKTGAVMCLTSEGLEREAINRYRRVHKARRLGL